MIVKMDTAWMNDDIDGNYEAVNRYSLEKFVPFVASISDHTGGTTRNLRKFVKLTRAFIAITDGGYFELKPSLRNHYGIDILKKIKYSRVGDVVSMIFGESTVVRVVDVRSRAHKSFFSERPVARTNGRLGLDLNEFNSLIFGLGFTVGPSKFDNIFSDVTQFASRDEIKTFPEHVGKSLGRGFERLINDVCFEKRKDHSFRHMMERMFVDAIGEQISDPKLLDLEAARYERTEDAENPKEWYVLSEMARLKADCLRVMDGFPPKTPGGIEEAINHITPFSKQEVSGGDYKSEMWNNLMGGLVNPKTMESWDRPTQ